MKNLFLIPARSNSKRLKDKNLANLASRPLIYHTIKICENFKKTADIFVSSDSSKILNYCKKFSFIKTRKRPKKFATNKSNLVDVAFDVLKNLNNFTYENIILLQPTSPLRTAEDLKKCLKIFDKKKLQSLTTVSKIREKLDELIKNQNNSWKYIFSKKSRLLKQDCDYIDGSIYISSCDFLKKYKSFVVEGKTKLIKLNNEYNVDVDYAHDLVLAKFFLENRNVKK